MEFPHAIPIWNETARDALRYQSGMSSERRPNRIREIREERGLSADALGRLAGMTGPTVTRLELGGLRLKTDQALALARALGVDQNQLLLKAGDLAGIPAEPAPDRKERPGRNVRAEVSVPELAVTPQGGGGSEMPEMDGGGHHPVVGHWSMPIEYLRTRVTHPQDVRIVQVAGDSMEPEYPAGERVMVDTSHRVPSPPGVYVLWDGFGLVLKRLELVMGTNPPVLRISSINSAGYPPYERGLDEVHINGRVIGKWQWK